MKSKHFIFGSLSNARFMNSLVKVINVESEISSFNKTTSNLEINGSYDLSKSIAEFLVLCFKEPLQLLSIQSNDEWLLEQINLECIQEQYTVSSSVIHTPENLTLKEILDLNKLEEGVLFDTNEECNSFEPVLTSKSILKINGTLFKLIMPLFGFELVKPSSSGNSNLYFIKYYNGRPEGYWISSDYNFSSDGSRYVYFDIAHLSPVRSDCMIVFLRKDKSELLNKYGDYYSIPSSLRGFKLSTHLDSFEHINRYILYLMNESELFFELHRLEDFNPNKFYDEIADDCMKKIGFTRVYTDETLLPSGLVMYSSNLGIDVKFMHPPYYDYYGGLAIIMLIGGETINLNQVLRETYGIEMERTFKTKDQYYQVASDGIKHIEFYLKKLGV